ncbi:copper chaperone PCu(A)C [Kitasatospora sp. NPDC096147]|uniref:copper chaperone PCu(A)C n=1 Tax=Kitasatospora sp. NPDC096147 TaxID=3364093 RepID=UPI003828DA0C
MGVLPPLAAVTTLALLCGWTATGQAGRRLPVRAEPGARVLVPATPGAPTAALVTLHNPGDLTDALTGASWGTAGVVTPKRHVHRAGAGSWEPVAELRVPARGELRMSVDGADLLIPRPPALRPGDLLPLTLRFRHGPDLLVQATAVAPGG